MYYLHNIFHVLLVGDALTLGGEPQCVFLVTERARDGLMRCGGFVGIVSTALFLGYQIFQFHCLPLVAGHAVHDGLQLALGENGITGNGVGVDQFIVDLLFGITLVVEHTGEGCQTDVPTAIGDAGIDGAEFDASALGQFPDRSVDPAVEHLVVILGSRFREVFLHDVIYGFL